MTKIQQIIRKNGSSVFQINIPADIVENTIISKGKTADFIIISDKELKIVLGDSNENN